MGEGGFTNFGVANDEELGLVKVLGFVGVAGGKVVVENWLSGWGKNSMIKGDNLRWNA